MPPTDTPRPARRLPRALIAILAVLALTLIVWFPLRAQPSVRWTLLDWRLKLVGGVHAVDLRENRPDVWMAADATEQQIAEALRVTRAHTVVEDVPRVYVGPVRAFALHARPGDPEPVPERDASALLVAARTQNLTGTVSLDEGGTWTLACDRRVPQNVCARAVAGFGRAAQEHPAAWRTFRIDQGERTSTVEDMPAAAPILEAVYAQREHLQDVYLVVRSIENDAGLREVVVAAEQAEGVRGALLAALDPAYLANFQLRLAGTNVTVYGPQPGQRGLQVARSVGALSAGAGVAVRGDGLEATVHGTAEEGRRIAALLPPDAALRTDDFRGTAGEYLKRG